MSKGTRTYRDEVLSLRAAKVPVRFVRHNRARHYVLRIARDGTARVTLPPFGTKREALAFALKHRVWLERELEAHRLSREDQPAWRDGEEFLFRGRAVRLVVDADLFGVSLCFADQVVHVSAMGHELKLEVEDRLRRIARAELPRVVRELGRAHDLYVKRVTVRGQRTLWGSCSSYGTISLNWRLVQAPEWVRDYVIIHELMHLQEMNHAPRFWKLVARACPRHRAAEEWLSAHAYLLAL